MNSKPQNNDKPIRNHSLSLFLIHLLLLRNRYISQPDPDPKWGTRPEIPECNGIAYKVQPGESLWIIGKRYGITVDQLLAENPHISDPNVINSGQIICIPKHHQGLSLTNIFDAASKRLSLTYLFGATSNQYLDMLSKTQNSINVICPDYFDIDENGNLLLATTEKLNQQFIDAIHGQGIKITPFISNHFDRALGIIALNNRDKLSDQIADAVEKYGLDGVDIDIENVTHEHRDMYTDFARLLREKLPGNKVVSSAVAANPNGLTVGWHGSYDYKRLSDYCDYLMLMNYDESYYGSVEGPVSSSDFFERSIQFVLNQEVPKDKIVVGIPFFGRYWKQGEEVGGIGLASRDVEFLTANYESTKYYDTATQSAHAVVTIKPNDIEPNIWGGRKLTAGTYSIWYDSPEATKYKLQIINKYDVLGSGSWALGQEILSIWDFYTQTLNK